MPKIECSCIDLSRDLVRMTKIILDNGGHIDEEIRIIVNDDMLSLKAPGNIDEGHPIIKMPSSLLLNIDDYSLKLDDDNIFIDGSEATLSSDNQELMQIMLDIFNRTNKIAFQRISDSSISYTLDPVFYKRITEYRFTGTGNDILNYLDSNDIATYTLQSYLKTRTLDFKTVHNKSIQVLMPIIDCLNHYPASQPCGGVDDENNQRHLLIFKSTPLTGSDECFIRYGVYDAIELYLIYHYVDQHCFFSRSIDFELFMTGIGKVQIRSTMQSAEIGNSPEALQDLGIYLPQISVDNQEGTADVSYLMIPQAMAPNSLRRIIRYIFSLLNPSLQDKDLTDSVLQAEKIILELNIKHYMSLLNFLKHYDGHSEMSSILQASIEAVNVQLKNIRSYPYYSDVTCR